MRNQRLRPRTRASTKTPSHLDESDSTVLTPLNFKVAPEFHREFKTFAAQHGKKMVEVLHEAFALLKENYGE